METKDYTGLDTSKFANDISAYALSPEYKKLLKDYMKDLTEKQVERIIKILHEGIQGNLTISQIAKQIERVVKDLDRASLISRTEVVRVSNEANRIRMENKGIEKAEWISAPEDGRLCPECKKMDGKAFSIKEIKGMIPLHPRCRCTFSEL
jgi:SPP1 gp7 family putative phage head morphogenesis protein